MTKRFLVSLAIGFLMLGIVVMAAEAAPITWSGNGHSYELVNMESPIKWTDANTNAISSKGYLATITSDQENKFIFDNIVAGMSAWFGGTHIYGQDLSTWQWTTSEQWNYTNWDPMYGQPDNTSDPSDHTLFYSSGNAYKWHDAMDWWGQVNAYVVEYDPQSNNPVPEPATMMLFGLGLLGLAGVSRKKN